MGRRWPIAGVLILLTAILTMPPTATTAAEAPNQRQRPIFVDDLTAPAGGGISQTAVAHISAIYADLGLTGEDVSDVVVTDVATLSRSGGHVVYIQQRHSGIDVFGALMSVVVDSSGSVSRVEHRFVPGVSRIAPPVAPSQSKADASRAAAAALGLAPSEPFSQVGASAGVDETGHVSSGGISRGDIPIRLVYQPTADGRVRLAWDLSIEELESENWWQIRVDAESGAELDRNDLVARDSYEVFDAPTEAPSFGSRTIVVNPADPDASPFGWHDTDGVAGAEFTITRGNNVSAFADIDNNNLPDVGSQPDGGVDLDFIFPLDLASSPPSYLDAEVTNLFYWNNILHDTFYAYGFDESSGNFQENNYGNGGLATDAVRAHAQDGGGVNNAFFTTPPDGSPPRMEMFVWTPSTPDRTSGLDSGIVAHEYGHGVSFRLTGGPSTVFCLSGNEQPGEGWSDYFGLMMTMEPGDAGTDARGFGTYVLDQPTTGAGIREFPYSTDQTIDPRTYDWIKTASAPHGVGSTFAAFLWDMTWALIDRDGFDPDLINGSGGNLTALQLVIDGLKIQPCNPGFVDARDAILSADVLTNGGANQCLIWQSFSGRGLGVSAIQGTSTSSVDGVEAFDVPAECSDLHLAKTATPDPVEPGLMLTFTLVATNNSGGPLTGVTITDPIPAGTSYVPDSADCAGTLVLDDLTLSIGTLGIGESGTCSFAVVVDPGAGTSTSFADDFESGTANWTTSHAAGATDWAISTADPHSLLQSAFATNPANITDQVIAMTDPVAATQHTVLSVWHRYGTEPIFDGGVIETSTDGLLWNDAGALITQNGYTNTIPIFDNPLSGRPAFSGDSNGYVETLVDLSSFDGLDVHVRFRLGTDSIVGANGWHIDDVVVRDVVTVHNVATASSVEGPTFVAESTTPVRQFAMLRVTTSPALPSQISVNGIPSDTWALDWVRLPEGNYEVCFTGVAGFDTPACETAELDPGVTTEVAGVFTERGFLRVDTDPPVQSTISIDGSPSDDWQVWTDLPVGDYEVCYGDVAGIATPPCETANVTAGATELLIGNFSVPDPLVLAPVGHGLLRVTTSPAVPSQISIDGAPADTWALDWVKLAPGSYLVCFSDVGGYSTPACETAVVPAAGVAEVVGSFELRALVRIDTSPAKQSTISVDGIPRDDWQVWTHLPAGTYQICYSEADGFVPPCDDVVVVPGFNPTIFGIWPP